MAQDMQVHSEDHTHFNVKVDIAQLCSILIALTLSQLLLK